MRLLGIPVFILCYLLGCNSNLDSNLSSKFTGDKGKTSSESIESTGLDSQNSESLKTTVEVSNPLANEPVMTAGGFLHCSVADTESRDQISCAIIDEISSTKINVPGLRDDLVEAFDDNLNKLDINFIYTDEGSFHWISTPISIDISRIRVRASANLQGLANQNEYIEIEEELPAADAEQFLAISNRQVNSQGSGWFRGNPGLNCLTTCQGNGGVNRTTMETFSNESFCREIIETMGLTIQTVNRTDFADRNLGCLFRPDLGILYITGVNNIDLNLAQGGIERICSCAL